MSTNRDPTRSGQVDARAATEPTVAPHPLLETYYADEAGRKRWLSRMFDASAEHYDWITGMMSLGTGRLYRISAVRRHGLVTGMKLLDVGTGTGVIARAAQDEVGPAGDVVAVDPSEGMLARARTIGVRRTLVGRAEDLPLADDFFDMLTMGYALRHVDDLNTTFAEYRRALRPGGKLLLLEITPPASRLGMWFLRAYLRRFVPLITRLFSRSRDAQTLMRYYWDTIEQCVPPETILTALRQAGFSGVERKVVLGILSEYSGVKPTGSADASP